MNRQGNFKKIFFFIPAAATVIFCFLFQFELFQKFELASYDWRMKKCQDKQPSGSVVIVFVGDETLKLLGQWPLSRQWYSVLTETF